MSMSSGELDQIIALLHAGTHSLVVYNNCYGGGPPRLNEEAQERYDEHARKYDNDAKGHGDELLVKVVVDFWKDGRNASRRCSQHGFVVVLNEFEEFVRVHEYDGLESPYVDREAFVRRLLDAKLEKDGKITKAEYEALRCRAEIGTLRYITRSRFPEVPKPAVRKLAAPPKTASKIPSVTSRNPFDVLASLE